VEYVDGLNYRMHSDCSYLIYKGPFRGCRSTVRKGFIHDFASIPRLLWRRFPPAGDGRNYYGLAAVWHDWLYEHQQVDGRPVSRRDADNIFYEIMVYVGVKRWVAWLMWLAVRIGGKNWHKHSGGAS
jgi:hypothetical protein